MKVQTTVKAGGRGSQHNETLVRASKKAVQPKAQGLKVKTGIKAGQPGGWGVPGGD